MCIYAVTRNPNCLPINTSVISHFSSSKFICDIVSKVTVSTKTMETQFDSVRDIVPTRLNWNLKVRVVRLWKRRDNSNNGSSQQAIELLLADVNVSIFNLYSSYDLLLIP